MRTLNECLVFRFIKHFLGIGIAFILAAFFLWFFEVPFVMGEIPIRTVRIDFIKSKNARGGTAMFSIDSDGKKYLPSEPVVIEIPVPNPAYDFLLKSGLIGKKCQDFRSPPTGNPPSSPSVVS